jgi:hypothetical protein
VRDVEQKWVEVKRMFAFVASPAFMRYPNGVLALSWVAMIPISI